MKKLISTLLFGAFALSVMAAELFTDNFPGEKIGSHWSGSGGTFSVADNALTIRSEKSNPVLYLNGKNSFFRQKTLLPYSRGASQTR